MPGTWGPAKVFNDILNRHKSMSVMTVTMAGGSAAAVMTEMKNTVPTGQELAFRVSGS